MAQQRHGTYGGLMRSAEDDIDAHATGAPTRESDPTVG